MKEVDTLQKELMQWYGKEARDLPWRNNPTPYRIWISEIMLQQTRVETVIPYFKRFLREIPTVQALSQVEEEKLLKLWQGLGYYRRALHLKEAALKIMERFDGEIPSEMKDLLSLPGIGLYTAGAISSMAYGKKEPAVDGNILRIAARVTANREDVSNAKNKKLLELFIRDLLPTEKAGDFNQALMDLGATICLPSGQPECGICPIKNYCEANQQNLTLEIPKKVPKRARRIERKTIFVLRHQDKFALIKRDGNGLLPNLWEFPNSNGHLTALQCQEVVRGYGLLSVDITALPPAKHIFSHLEWDMVGFSIAVSRCSDTAGFLWATKEEIHQQYSIPTAFKSFTKFCCD